MSIGMVREVGPHSGCWNYLCLLVFPSLPIHNCIGRQKSRAQISYAGKSLICVRPCSPILRHLLYSSETLSCSRLRPFSPIRFRRFLQETFKNRPVFRVSHLSVEWNGHVRWLSTSRPRCQSDQFEKTVAVSSTARRGHLRCGCTKSIGALFKDSRSLIGKGS